MPRLKHRALTEAGISKSGLAVGTHTDGGGLTLRVSESGAKRWVLRSTIDGKARNIGLGSYPTVSLAVARKKAADHQASIRDGRDPVAEKRAKAELERAVSPTFSEVAQTCWATHRPTWRSQKHGQQWLGTLETYAYPVVGHKPVDAVTIADVMTILQPIWTSKHTTASRVRQRMEIVFSYARARGYRSGDNPAGRELIAVLPKQGAQVKEHRRALPYADVPAAVEKVRRSSCFPTTIWAIEFMILTAARSGEVRLATWDEVDWEGKAWTIPAHRMKAGKEHRVPLSDQAIKLLRRAWIWAGGYDATWMFPSQRGKVLSDSGLSLVFRRLEIPAVPHGFRSSFRDWAVETGKDWTLAETALAHRLGTSVEVAYARTTLFEQRRTLMQQWADYLTNEPSVGGAESERPAV